MGLLKDNQPNNYNCLRFPKGGSCNTVTKIKSMAHQQAVKVRLAMVGINNFPTQVDDPLWVEIRQSVTPSLTL